RGRLLALRVGFSQPTCPWQGAPVTTGEELPITLGGTHFAVTRNPCLQANLTDQTVNKCTRAFRPERCRTDNRCLHCASAHTHGSSLRPLTWAHRCRAGRSRHPGSADGRLTCHGICADSFRKAAR